MNDLATSVPGRRLSPVSGPLTRGPSCWQALGVIPREEACHPAGAALRFPHTPASALGGLVRCVRRLLWNCTVRLATPPRCSTRWLCVAAPAKTERRRAARRCADTSGGNVREHIATVLVRPAGVGVPGNPQSSTSNILRGPTRRLRSSCSCSHLRAEAIAAGPWGCPSWRTRFLPAEREGRLTARWPRNTSARCVADAVAVVLVRTRREIVRGGPGNPCAEGHVAARHSQK
mmetsp:Transcript_26272/g.57783  ORF Transcript_26272/g.57783 Transcript_26272/m.57783 type:complete len:232 (+) Transcript_26272:295-990(+)